MIFVRCPFFKSLKCVDTDSGGTTVSELVSRISNETGVPENVLLPHDGCKRLSPESVVQWGTTVYFTLSLPGGKGGFGSMLRAIGAQIEKTTNREACRDLSGRRLRDINEEQRLKKWLAKKVEREAEAERRHRERLLRLKQEPKHDFNDPEYNKIRSELPDRIDDALSEGLKKEKKAPVKKHLEEKAGPSSKKPCLWLGLDVSSDSDSEEEVGSEKSASNSSKDSTSCKDTHDKDSNESFSDETASGVCTSVSCNPDSAEDPECSNSLDITVTKSEDNEVVQETTSPPEEEITCVMKQEGGAIEKEMSAEDLMSFNSVQELEELGLEKLKDILKQLGLKCGGTLSERAHRVWSIRGLDPKDYPPSLRVKVKQKNVISK